MTVTEKVAYAKGLLDGVGFEKDSKEDRVFRAIVDALEDIAVSVVDLEDDVCELCEQIDAIDEDLDTMEADFYDDDCDCDDCDGEEFYEIKCPGCGEEINIDEETLLEGGIQCPNCNEELEFDMDVEDDDSSNVLDFSKGDQDGEDE